MNLEEAAEEAQRINRTFVERVISFRYTACFLSWTTFTEILARKER